MCGLQLEQYNQPWNKNQNDHNHMIPEVQHITEISLWISITFYSWCNKFSSLLQEIITRWWKENLEGLLTAILHWAVSSHLLGDSINVLGILLGNWKSLLCFKLISGNKNSNGLFIVWWISDHVCETVLLSIWHWYRHAIVISASGCETLAKGSIVLKQSLNGNEASQPMNETLFNGCC